jgi:hypothetical protein
MDTDKKFTFSKNDIGTPYFPKFSTETTDGAKGLASKFTFEGPVMDGVSLKNETNSAMSAYKTEATLNMAKLAGVDGLTLTLTANQAKKSTIKAEYKSDMACVCVETTPETLAAPSFSVGVAAAGVNVGVSGSVSDPVSQVALGYSQSGLSAMLGLSGGFKKAEARCLYKGIDGVDIAVKADDLLGAPSITAGAVYTVDSDTSVKVVVAQKGMGIKSGVAKTLSKGCQLTIGHSVAAADIANPSAHTLGWTLEIK